MSRRRGVIRERGRARLCRVPGRRGVILLATFVVIVIAAMTAGTIVQTTTAQRMGLSASGARAQSRALAWSGVLGAMVELEGQREALLRGAEPELTSEWVVYEEEGGERGVVRLRAIGGRTARPEAARLDVNSATAEMLAKLEGIGQGGAERIVAARKEGLFGSATEALGAVATDGVGAAGSGRGDEAGGGAGDFPPVDGVPPEVTPAPAGETALMGADVAELVTVFSADPAVQAGIGPEGNRSAGEPCIRVDDPWDESTRRALERRFAAAVLDSIQPPAPEETDDRSGTGSPTPGSGEPAADEQQRPPATTAELIERVSSAGLAPEGLAEVLDAMAIDAGDFRFGRIDIMHAPEAVLRCIPGVDQAAAAAIVERRGSLDEEARLSPAWLLTEGILTEEGFRKAAEYVTTRCLQWRIVVEAGIEERALGGDDTGDLMQTGEGGQLRHRVALEVVIDVAGERARVAYLRDVTLLDAAEAVAGLQEEGDESFGDESAALARPEDLPEPDSRLAGSNADERDVKMDGLSFDGLDLDTDLGGEKEPEDSVPSSSAANSTRTPTEPLTEPLTPSRPADSHESAPQPIGAGGGGDGTPARGRIGRWRSR